MVVNDSVILQSKNSSDSTNNNTANSTLYTLTKDKIDLGPKKLRSSESIKSVGPKSDEIVKSINITVKKSNTIKETLIHDKIDYKPSINLIKKVFEELKEFYSSNHYDRNLYNIKVNRNLSSFLIM